MKIDIFSTDKKYNVIYSDPPWRQTKGGARKVRPNQTRKLDYDTISLEEIKDYQNQAISIANDNHVCFLWTIDKYLHAAETIMHELGYRLHARIIWDKTNGVAPAFTVRFSHEYLLWFYRGKLLPISKEVRGKFTTVMREKATRHSQKPICAYQMIEALYPEYNKIEMFARNYRDGWDCWGNEV